MSTTSEKETRDRLAELLSHHGVAPSDELVKEAAHRFLELLDLQPFSPFVYAALGRAWDHDSQELTRFRTWCLKHPRRCKQIFHFTPSPGMSAVQSFHSALLRSFGVAPVKTRAYWGNFWVVAPDDRIPIQKFIEEVLVKSLPWAQHPIVVTEGSKTQPESETND